MNVACLFRRLYDFEVSDALFSRVYVAECEVGVLHCFRASELFSMPVITLGFVGDLSRVSDGTRSIRAEGGAQQIPVWMGVFDVNRLGAQRCTRQNERFS